MISWVCERDCFSVRSIGCRSKGSWTVGATHWSETSRASTPTPTIVAQIPVDGVFCSRIKIFSHNIEWNCRCCWGIRTRIISAWHWIKCNLFVTSCVRINDLEDVACDRSEICIVYISCEVTFDIMRSRGSSWCQFIIGVCVAVPSRIIEFVTVVTWVWIANNWVNRRGRSTFVEVTGDCIIKDIIIGVVHVNSASERHVHCFQDIIHRRDVWGVLLYFSSIDERIWGVGVEFNSLHMKFSMENVGVVVYARDVPRIGNWIVVFAMISWVCERNGCSGEHVTWTYVNASICPTRWSETSRTRTPTPTIVAQIPVNGIFSTRIEICWRDCKGDVSATIVVYVVYRNYNFLIVRYTSTCFFCIRWTR